jgi:RNA polymerase sigma-70 factor (ECF subfamily)
MQYGAVNRVLACEQPMSCDTPDQSLDRTLAGAAAGEAPAWRVLVDTYSPRVFALVLRQCGDRELAEEIAQATFVKVVTHLGKYSERGRFEPWLFRIAMNKLRDEMRRRKRQARPMDMSPGSAPGSSSSEAGNGGGEQAWAAVHDQISGDTLTDHESPLDKLTRAEQVVELRRAIAKMSKPDQEILYLRHTAGMSFAQIAETLEQPLGTVLARGHRALGKLKKMMTEDEDEPAEHVRRKQKESA